MRDAGVGQVDAALLERDHSLASLAVRLDEVRKSSEGRLVFLGGEAGVGKTSLLRHFCRTGAGRARVLWGACAPLRTPPPLGPLVDVAEATGGELEALVGAAARPHEVAAAVLRELRRRTPTVLVFEDLHWADEATLDVLALLAARVASAPALLIASYRDDELDRTHQLRLVLGELVRGPGRMKLDALSMDAVAELARPHGIEPEELYARTGGNPFFVTEVLAAGGEHLPETVRDAVLARAVRLSEPARGLLDAAAVIPGQLELWLLEALAGEIVGRLDECLASGILATVPGGVAFRHELARLAIEEAISPDLTPAMHRRALAALAARGGAAPDAAALAHHAEAAGDAESVLRWAPLAAERAAASGSHREAAAQYARALRFAAGLSLGERAELLERRGEECYLSAQIDGAIAAQQEALECHRARGDALREGDALRVLSRTLYFVGRTGEGEAAGEAAVELLERLPPGHELALTYCNVSQRQMVVEKAEEAHTWGARALELAERLGDTEALVYALTNIGARELRAGEEEGRHKLERALSLAQQNGLEDHAARIFNSLVMWPLRLRRFADAERYLAPGLQYCAERGLDTWRLYLLASRARLELDRGHWDAAADVAASVLRDPHSASVARNWALVVLGLVRARRGDAEASEPLAEAQALAESTEELMRIGPTAAARAELAWLSGDSAAVDSLTASALALATGRRVPWAAGELAYWRWRAGLRDGLPPELVAEPYRLSIAGEWARADELWDQIGCPYEAALALGDADDDAALRQSLDNLQQLDARPAAAIVARRLRERGVRGVPRGPRQTTRENPAGLTARELEVLTLLADGLRNTQIAERLVVSEKTVDHHVSAILRKLNVRTRGEAATVAIRHGIVAPEHEAPGVSGHVRW
jgi:DNA-binding CsgD family transcriptional regulator/tetratricopeptide (TPR) repeat protein